MVSWELFLQVRPPMYRIANTSGSRRDMLFGRGNSATVGALYALSVCLCCRVSAVSVARRTLAHVARDSSCQCEGPMPR